MKNSIYSILFLLVTFPSFSQGLKYDEWDVVETVDDFGDKTGEKVARYFSEGKFSNSATSGEDMIVKIVDYGIGEDGSGQAAIDFFEYKKTQAVLAYSTEKGVMKVKLPDGSVESFSCYALKSGGIVFWDKEYEALMSLINNGKSEKMRFVVSSSDFSEYGGSKYQGYFHTKAANQVD